MKRDGMGGVVGAVLSEPAPGPRGQSAADDASSPASRGTLGETQN